MQRALTNIPIFGVERRRAGELKLERSVGCCAILGVEGGQRNEWIVENARMRPEIKRPATKVRKKKSDHSQVARSGNALWG
jgi:hypothetical protein